MGECFFWYRPTQVVPDQRPLNGRCCCCIRQSTSIRYDTIRDAILTCARKPTRVSLIYRTKPTTRKCKNRKTNSRKQICSEITVNSPVNPCSESWRRKRKVCGGKDLHKKDNSCLQALTKDISTPADIAPSALETIVFYCFMGYISALTYYLLLLILKTAVYP